MRVDIKIVVLSLIAICLILEAEAWFGSRRSSSSSGRSRSPSSSRRSSGGWFGGRRSSSSSSSRRTSSTRSSGGWFGGRRSSSSSSSRRTSSTRKSGWFSSSSSSSSSSSRSKKTFPHDIKTKSGLTKLYNQKVTNVQPVERPLGGYKNGKYGKVAVKIANKFGIKTSISGQKDRATHSGVLVTTQDGKKYLVHKGKGYAPKGSSQTVVVDAKHMSKQWKNVGKSTNGGGRSVGDLVKAGGKDYKLSGGNCHDATDKMKGRKKRSLCSGK